MGQPRIAIIGVGATGTVLAAALLRKYPDTVLVGRNSVVGKKLLSDGIHVSGAISYQTPVKNFILQIEQFGQLKPDIIFLATKTFHLDRILEVLEEVYYPGIKIVSTQISSQIFRKYISSLELEDSTTYFIVSNDVYSQFFCLFC